MNESTNGWITDIHTFWWNYIDRWIDSHTTKDGWMKTSCMLMPCSYTVPWSISQSSWSSPPASFAPVLAASTCSDMPLAGLELLCLTLWWYDGCRNDDYRYYQAFTGTVLHMIHQLTNKILQSTIRNLTIPSVIRKFTSTSSIGENCSTIINHHRNHHSKWWHLN